MENLDTRIPTNSVILVDTNFWYGGMGDSLVKNLRDVGDSLDRLNPSRISSDILRVENALSFVRTYGVYTIPEVLTELKGFSKTYDYILKKYKSERTREEHSEKRKVRFREFKNVSVHGAHGSFSQPKIKNPKRCTQYSLLKKLSSLYSSLTDLLKKRDITQFLSQEQRAIYDSLSTNYFVPLADYLCRTDGGKLHFSSKLNTDQKTTAVAFALASQRETIIFSNDKDISKLIGGCLNNRGNLKRNNFPEPSYRITLSSDNFEEGYRAVQTYPCRSLNSSVS